MRLADSILRRGHLSERALVDILMTGARPVHLDRCGPCAERAVELGRWLDEIRTIELEEADAAFPAERLARSSGRSSGGSSRPSARRASSPSPACATSGRPGRARHPPGVGRHRRRGRPRARPPRRPGHGPARSRACGRAAGCGARGGARRRPGAGHSGERAGREHRHGVQLHPAGYRRIRSAADRRVAAMDAYTPRALPASELVLRPVRRGR